MVRVLIIEDEPDSGYMLARLLESAGYSASLVDTVPKAIQALEVDAHDLVLADLMVDRVIIPPPWDYIDRVVDLAQPAPVGLLTGWEGVEREAFSHGASFVLSKPCKRERLFAQLATTLKLPPLEAAAVATIERYFRAIETGAYDELRAVVCRDVVYRLPGSDQRYSNELRGVDELVAFTRQTFATFGEPRFDIRSVRPLPRGALVEYVGSWLEGAERRELPGAVIFELRDARIQRVDVRLHPDELH